MQGSFGVQNKTAFRLLKEKLTAAPVLGMLRDEGTYYLDTDASDVGLGAVLSQDQDEQGLCVQNSFKDRTKL